MIGRAVRRIAAATLVVLGGAAACDGGAPAPTATSGGGAVGCARPAVSTPDVTLTPGPTDGVPKTTAAGEALVIDAVVLDRACRPASGADLRIWHTDTRGLYGPKGGDDCCFYEARGQTDHSGRFRLRTIRPARYPEANAPPPHIHLRIDHGGPRTEVTIVFGSGSPPATVTPADGPVGVLLTRDSAGWRGEAVLLLSQPYATGSPST